MFSKFRKTAPKFRVLKLVFAEKKMRRKKCIFNIQKNSLLHRWSQLGNSISVLSSCNHIPKDEIFKVIDNLGATAEFN